MVFKTVIVFAKIGIILLFGVLLCLLGLTIGKLIFALAM